MTRTRRATTVTNGQSLTASITVFDGVASEIGAAVSRMNVWQRIAWDYWGRLGELMYPTTQLSRHMTRLSWDVSIDGEPLARTPDPNESDAVDEFMAKVTDGLGVNEAVRLLSLNIQVAAECWYLHHEERGWSCVSVVEPKLRDLLDDRSYEKLYVIVNDPRDQRVAISPFATIIGPAEEILTYESQSRAQSRSRLAQAGILLRPSEAIFDDDNDPFGDDLEVAMTAPIIDERSPAAVVPMDIEVPGETIEKFRHLTFERKYDDKIHEKIERATTRIAIALDIPPELLLGIGDLNHWSAWLVQEDTYVSHVEPLAMRVGEVFAVAGEHLGLGSNIVVTPDPGDLLAKRSTVSDAFAGARIGAVGLDYVREAMGATPKDVPTEDDIALIRILTGSGGAGAGLGEPPGETTVTAPSGTEPTAPTPGGDEGPPPIGGSPAEATARDQRDGLARPVVAAAIDPASASEDELILFGIELAQIDAELRNELAGAMSMAISVARNRVGAKLRSKIRNTPEHDALPDVDNADLVARYGARTDQVVPIEPTIRESLGDLVTWWSTRLDEARRSLMKIAGIDTTTAAWNDAAVASRRELEERLTTFVAGTIYRTSANMLAAPSDIAREVVAVAGGS